MKIRAAASRYKYGGNAFFFIKFPHPVYKRNNRLLTAMYNPLHQHITNHKICCTGILINQQQLCLCFHSFCYTCCLRCTAAGILRNKMYRVFSVWQIADKHGNIHIVNASAIFCRTFTAVSSVTVYSLPSPAI